MCKICDHPNRKKIDAAIVSGMKNPTIYHDLINSGPEKNWIQALKDHKRYGHISKLIQAAANEYNIKTGLNIQTCAQEIYNIATGAAKDARIAKQFGAVGSCLGPAAKVLEILNKGNSSDDDKPGIDRALDRMKNDRDARRANL